MPKIKLTKRIVDAIEPEEKDVIYWDTELKGFGLKVTPKGKKSYFAYYRNEEGRQRKPSIGAHGPVTLEKARSKAQSILQNARDGGDFSRDRQEKKKAETVKELSERYICDYAEGRKKASSIKQDQRMIDTKILPALGIAKVHSVSRLDVNRLHQSLKRTPYEANRVLSLLSKMFNLAEKWTLRADGSNPCRHVEKFPEKKRERFLSEAELSAVAETMRQIEYERGEYPEVLAAIRMLIFTGARLSEIQTLKWEYINHERQCIDLPDSKTGKKSIPLTAPAIEVLSSLKKKKGIPYCFAVRESYHKALHRPWGRIRQRASVLIYAQDDLWAGLIQKMTSEDGVLPTLHTLKNEAKKRNVALPIGLTDVRIHDLRHTYASQGAAIGLSLPMIGKLLGHSQPQTTARYAHLANDPVRQASENIASQIKATMDGKNEGAEVIPLKRN